MQVYLFTGGVESEELAELERRVSARLPTLQRLARIDEVRRQLTENGNANSERIYIIFPMFHSGASFERIVSIAEKPSPGLFLIFVSREISASDYKRLVRGGSADWVSLQNAPQEILDIIARTNRKSAAPGEAERKRPAIAALVPSSGGVGNATLAIECAVQLKASKQARDKKICLLDLDVQTSHVCDYLDIESRLQVGDLIDDPSRLDEHLFELFISHHSASGIDVLAAPRGRNVPDLSVMALDALFGFISERYDMTIVDLPGRWADWTDQIISVCDLAIVTGLNNVPGLRQIAETLIAVRKAPAVPAEIVVALNRCERSLLGGVARRQHVQRILGREQVIYIREDMVSANHGLNTGVPISLGMPSSRIAKDIRALVALMADLKPVAGQSSSLRERR
jgi:pilus assembly protein CpaE